MSAIDPLYDALNAATGQVLDGFGELDVLLGGVSDGIGEIPTVVGAVGTAVTGGLVSGVAEVLEQATVPADLLEGLDELLVDLPGGLGGGLSFALENLGLIQAGLLDGLGVPLGEVLGDSGPVLGIATGVIDELSGVSEGLPVQFDNISDISILASDVVLGGASSGVVAALDAVAGSEGALTVPLAGALDVILGDQLGPYGGAVVDGVQTVVADVPVAVEGVVTGTASAAQTFVTDTGENVEHFATTTGATVDHFATTLSAALAAAPEDPLAAVGMIAAEAQGVTVPALTSELQTDLTDIGAGGTTAAGEIGLTTSDFLDDVSGSLGDVVADIGLM